MTHKPAHEDEVCYDGLTAKGGFYFGIGFGLAIILVFIVCSGAGWVIIELAKEVL